MAGLIGSAHEVFNEAIDNGLAVGSGKICRVDFNTLLLCVVQCIDNSGLETGEAEIERCAFHMRTRQNKCLVVTGFGELIHVDAAGIGHTHGAGSLIKCFACGIVACFAENAKRGVVLSFNDMGVAAGNNETEEWRFQLRICDVVRSNVASEMVYRDERQICGKGEALRKVYADEQRTDETRGVRYTDGIDIA